MPSLFYGSPCRSQSERFKVGELNLSSNLTAKAEDVSPQTPSEISNSASLRSVCSPWDAPWLPPSRKKLLKQTRPFQPLCLSHFPSTPRSRGANRHPARLLDTTCPVLISYNASLNHSQERTGRRGGPTRGITPRRQGATPPRLQYPSPKHTESPSETLLPRAEVSSLSPYLRLLQAPVFLVKKTKKTSKQTKKESSRRGPDPQLPFLAGSLPLPHTVRMRAGPPARFTAAPARAREGELEQRKFILASVSSFLPL